MKWNFSGGGRASVIAGFLAWQAASHGSEGIGSPSEIKTLVDEHGAAAQPHGQQLALLRSFYSPGLAPQSNHYLEMWTGAPLHEVAEALGLINNRALFINSHGGSQDRLKPGHRTRGGRTGYVFYPHADLIGRGELAPVFSVEDVRQLIGVAATNIHNIVISGCNREGALDVGEIRSHFPSATNIVHVAPGHFGYQPMLFQALSKESDEIDPLYESVRRNHARRSYLILRTPQRGVPTATRLKPYIADLFLDGESRPFKTQLAGRELLIPVK